MPGPGKCSRIFRDDGREGKNLIVFLFVTNHRDGAAPSDFALVISEPNNPIFRNFADVHHDPEQVEKVGGVSPNHIIQTDVDGGWVLVSNAIGCRQLHSRTQIEFPRSDIGGRKRCHVLIIVAPVASYRFKVDGLHMAPRRIRFVPGQWRCRASLADAPGRVPVSICNEHGIRQGQRGHRSHLVAVISAVRSEHPVDIAKGDLRVLDLVVRDQVPEGHGLQVLLDVESHGGHIRQVDPAERDLRPQPEDGRLATGKQR